MQIWMAELDRPLEKLEYAALLHNLPSARRERFLRTRDSARQQEPLCAYWLLKIMLRQEYGFEKIPEIAFGAAGKPFFPEYPQIYFNISHTKGAVMVAIADVPVGVDLEMIRPVNARMMERMPHSGTPEDFFRCWVRQEACAKCSGVGIAEFLHREIELPAQRQYFELDAFPGYLAGIAVERGERPENACRLIWSRDLAHEVTDSFGKD